MEVKHLDQYIKLPAENIPGNNLAAGIAIEQDQRRKWAQYYHARILNFIFFGLPIFNTKEKPLIT